MTDEHTPANLDHEPRDGPSGADVAPLDANATPSRTNRDWIVPAVGLGAVLLTVVVFAGGFFVGRATDDSGQVDADEVVFVQGERRGIVPRGFTFEDFGRRGPEGRFDDQRPRQFRDFGSFPEVARERLCDLLHSGAIPPDAPFVDRLTELCSTGDI